MFYCCWMECEPPCCLCPRLNKFANRVVSAIRAKMQGKVKLTHILLETVIILLSTLVFFPLGKITEHFNQNCLLNSNIHVIRHSNDSVSLDLAKTVFGDIDDCNFTTFFSVMVALHGLIWIWFFFHIDNLAMSDGSSINVLLPALVTRLILFICAIVSSVMIGDGFSAWCDQIESNNKDSFGQRLSCEKYQSLSWTEDRSSFYTYNLMASISSWIVVAFILISMVMTCVHLYWDFQSTMLGKQEGKESVETSGYVDNGVGITNKLAWNYSTDGFYTDSIDSDSSIGEVTAAPVRAKSSGRGGGGGGGGEGGSGSKTTSTKKDSRHSSSPDEMVVNATVHTPGGAESPEGAGREEGEKEEEEEKKEEAVVGRGGEEATAEESSFEGLRNRGNAVTTQ